MATNGGGGLLLANGSQAAAPPSAALPHHQPHDSLSVCSSKEDDLAKIRELEDEVRVLADKANAACM